MNLVLIEIHSIFHTTKFPLLHYTVPDGISVKKTAKKHPKIITFFMFFPPYDFILSLFNLSLGYHKVVVQDSDPIY